MHTLALQGELVQHLTQSLTNSSYYLLCEDVVRQLCHIYEK
jgi:hypothetical protein